MNFVYLDVLDPNSKRLKKALNYRVIPQFILLDGEGNIVQQWIGEVSEVDLDAAIQKIIP